MYGLCMNTPPMAWYDLYILCSLFVQRGLTLESHKEMQQCVSAHL